MVKVNLALCLLLITAAASIGAGQTIGADRLKVFTVPREHILPVVVYQPDCPLRVEGTLSYIVSLEGGAGLDYKLRHTGTKPIQAYTIAWLTFAGRGEELSFTAKTEMDRIKPGEVIPRERRSADFVPLTDDLRKKFKIDRSLYSVVYLMVVRIEFDDGTIYSDEEAYKNLIAHLEK